MAEHTKFHLWLNTSIASLALFASIGSALFQWRSVVLKSEIIGLHIDPSFDCKLSYELPHKADNVIDTTTSIDLCWTLTITNQSEVRASLVNVSLIGPHDNQLPIGEMELDDEQGHHAAIPIILDGGAAQRYLIRLRIWVEPPVLQALKELQTGQARTSLTLGDLEQALTWKGYDLFGDPLDLIPFELTNETRALLGGGDVEAHIVQSRHQGQVFGNLDFKTGRGQTLVAPLPYPTLYDRWVIGPKRGAK